MFRSTAVIAASVVLSLLTGCATTVPLQRGQVDAISRDTRPDAVDQMLGKATPTAEFDFPSDAATLRVRHYLLQTGSRQEMSMVCTPACFPVFYAVPVTAPYLVMQRLPSHELYAWGTLEELSKDPDPAVSSIMPGVKARLSQALQEKK